MTTEASSRSRAARAGSSSCEITYGACTTSIVRVVAHERLELAARGPHSEHAQARRAPPRRALPRRLASAPWSLPIASSATVTAVLTPRAARSRAPCTSCTWGTCDARECGEPHCAQTTTGDRAGHALIAALVAAGFRGLLLRDRHTARKRSGRAAERLQQLAQPLPARVLGRLAAARDEVAVGAALRAQARRSPRGSGSRSAARGSRCRVAQRSTSSSSPSRYGVVSSSSTSGVSAWYSRAVTVDSSARRPRGSAGTGRRSSTSNARSKSSPPARRVRPSSRPHARRGSRAVLLRAGRERGDRDGHLRRGGGRRARAGVCGGRRASSHVQANAAPCEDPAVTRRARARTARRSGAAAARGRAARRSGTCRG